NWLRIPSDIRKINMAEMTTVNVALDSRSYPIQIGAGWIDNLGPTLAPHFPPRPLTIVTNPILSDLGWVERVEKSLATAGFDISRCEIPSGEDRKTIGTVTAIHDHMLSRKATRQSGLVALGGGIVGDVAGFAAASLLRGIPYIQLPTTLLAMVDSSVGGKTG